MVENENIVVNDVTPPQGGEEKKSGWSKFVAGTKEWFRKQIVNLKRRPSNIAFFVFIVTSLIYLISYSTMAQMLYAGRSNPDIEWSGLCSFICFLFSILVLLLFMNAFPKRKKINIVMLVFVGIFVAAMLACDVVCYLEVNSVIVNNEGVLEDSYEASRTLFIVHMIFLGISAVVLAFTPLIKKGLMKINTRKEVQSAEMKGELDLQETEE